MPVAVRDWLTGEIVEASDLEDLESRLGAYADAASMRAQASSQVSTMPRHFVQSSMGTMSSGQISAGRARVQTAGTYSKIRFCTGSTAFSGVTDLRCGVWDASSAVLAETANASATVTAVTTVYELSLITPITLAFGVDVFLGIGVIGTTPPIIRGSALPTVLCSVAPVLARTKTSWTTGPLVALTSDTGQLPWMELVP